MLNHISELFTTSGDPVSGEDSQLRAWDFDGVVLHAARKGPSGSHEIP